MPTTVSVSGSFVRNNQPVLGVVRFTPERLWVIEGGIAWATLAPVAVLEGGRFTVQLTPTDIDAVPWYYQVETPAGAWRVRVYRAVASYGLKELLNEHHPGPRPKNR